MYLVRWEGDGDGAVHLVFTLEDPRKDGYTGEMIEGVVLEQPEEDVHKWDYGTPMPQVVVGQHPTETNHYRVFKYVSEREEAGFVPLPGTPHALVRWEHFARLCEV